MDRIHKHKGILSCFDFSATPFTQALHWRTRKKTAIFKKTHINRSVMDSAWELAHAKELDKSPYVEAWVKNDHLGFEISYIHNGALHSYTPDFIIRLSDKSFMILEVKGRKKPKDESKWDYMKFWIKAVNQDEENGFWRFRVSQDKTGRNVHSMIEEILKIKKTA